MKTFSKLKICAFAGLIAILGGVCGFWLRSMILTSVITLDSPTIINHGYGEFPVEAYIDVNEGLDSKIDEICGSYTSHEVYAAVLPMTSGYRVRIVADGNSSVWDGSNKERIQDWISTQMAQIQSEEWKKQNKAEMATPRKPSD